MTATSARNSYGIFKTKRARLLAIQYSLNLYDKNSYIHDGNLILYSDVKFIVDNLWMDHFYYGSHPPILVSFDEYNHIFNSLKIIYPNLLSFSHA